MTKAQALKDLLEKVEAGGDQYGFGAVPAEGRYVMDDLPKGNWCTCGFPHKTGGPCWECRTRGMGAAMAASEAERRLSALEQQDMPDREVPATSWAVWAWQAYRDGRLILK